MVIDKINLTVEEDDYLIIFGETSIGDFESTKSLMSQIKARWEIVDLEDQPLYKIEEFWKDMGAQKARSLDGFVIGTINGEKANVIIATNSSNISLWLGEKNYIAMAESAAIENQLLKEDEIYRDQILNLSLSIWDFCPIDYTEVPKLIDNEIFV